MTATRRINTQTDIGTTSRPSRLRRAARVIGPAAILVLALGGAGAWLHRAGLAAADREIAEGRHAAARDRLESLRRWWPGPPDGGVERRLGDCEAALGRPEAAIAAWARVPESSPEAEAAALRRAASERDLGRLASAEQTLLRALRKPGPLAIDLRHELIQVLWTQLRTDEAAALIERNWAEQRRRGGADAPATLANLRARIALELEVFPVERVRTLLQQAAAPAPEDDRVWLGQANLALVNGALDEARAWLDRCRASRPDDPAVARSLLQLAEATDDPSLAREASRHLAAADLPATAVARIRAWFARRRGDLAEAERIWSEQIREEPTDVTALDRLAELAAIAGRREDAASWQRRKSELDRLRREYVNRAVGFRNADAETLSVEAEALGRRFEARAFQALAFALRPTEANRDRLARLDRPPATPIRSTPLVELLGPIDAGPPAKAAPGSRLAVAFADAAKEAGLEFWFQNGRSPRRQLPETMSGGVGLLDYDGDGHLDVYAVQGGTFPPEAAADAPGDRLFRNRGDGTFDDATDDAGLPTLTRGYGHGVAVGDVDGDGRPDLLVTRWRAYALYLNRGGRFDDVTDAWGLGGDRDWPTSAAFADLDGDGDLDLYVCHYITWDAENPRLCGTESGASPMYCAPHLLPHAVDRVYRNDGDRFVDVSESSGVAAADVDGRGLGVVAADFDDDGLIDLYVANDGTANFLFRNLGGFRFEEVGLSAGVAANAEGGYQAGMGIGCGDLDGDGRLDLTVTNFYGESTTFFRSLGPGLFADQTARVGLREASRYRLGFGTAIADMNDDGYPDVVTANGHVNDSRPVIPYAMPAQLLLGGPGGGLTDVTASAGPPWDVPRVGRGLAVGDLDNDGRLDAILVDLDGPLAYFRNRTEGGRSLTLGLIGTDSNRDGIGAVLEVRAGARRWTLARFGGGSYQSSGDPRLHVGLGDVDRVDEVTVRWPSGRIDRHRDLDAGRGYALTEGSDRPAPLVGFGTPPPGATR